ncbi:MAG: hypothetical protein Tsb006_5130 [Rickettsiaceae bacterium]
MTTDNLKPKNQKAVIFFDCEYSDINPNTPPRIERFCLENNFDLLSSFYKYNNEFEFIRFEGLLHKLDQTIKMQLAPLVVIIGEYTYQQQENLLSSAALGILKSLNLIELYVYTEDEEQQQLTIKPYDDKSNLIEIAVTHLNQLKESLDTRSSDDK